MNVLTGLHEHRRGRSDSEGSSTPTAPSFCRPHPGATDSPAALPKEKKSKDTSPRPEAESLRHCSTPADASTYQTGKSVRTTRATSPLQPHVRSQHARRDRRHGARRTARVCVDRETDASGNKLQLLARYGQNDCAIAQGHRVWLFAQTQQGARASANLYSLVSCARVNGIEPYAYLRHLFQELPKASTAEDIEALLPWNVKPVLRANGITNT